jgi:uncharacterized membrane protein YedE/YeeE
MKPLVVSFLAGLVFALGVGVAGMTQPTKVVGFLDVTGRWDPSLAFVMVGAIGVAGAVFRLTRSHAAPLFAPRFIVPTRGDVDLRLIGGAALFGIGWGLGGLCPGPALTALASGAPSTLIFVVAMLAGMALHAATGMVRGRADEQTTGTTSQA